MPARPARYGMPAARHPAAPHAAATPPEVAAANTISRSRSPNRNIAAIEPRAHIGQASDFSPISNLQIESKNRPLAVREDAGALPLGML